MAAGGEAAPPKTNRRKVDVLDGQRLIEIAPEALRHIGDAGGDRAPVTGIPMSPPSTVTRPR